MTDKELVKQLKQMLSVAEQTDNDELYHRLAFYYNLRHVPDDTDDVRSLEMLASIQPMLTNAIKNMGPAEILATVQVLALFLKYLTRLAELKEKENLGEGE